MLHKTQGIVLSHIKYGETSIIARIFTEVSGLQSYIIHGLRKKKSQYSMALFQSLTLLDIVVYHRKQRGLQRIAEVKCSRPNSHLLLNIKKTTIAVFLADLLAKVLHKEEHNKPLFNFLWQAVLALEKQSTNYELFHLEFMLQLCRYLGFGISTTEEIYSQLRYSGQYKPPSQQAIQGLNNLLKKETKRYVLISKPLRRELLDTVIQFYQLHIESLCTLPSLKVLQEIS